MIRVLSYNIRSMRDDTEALARVIRACAPDLVLVQEAPRFFRWRKARREAGREQRPGGPHRGRHRRRTAAAVLAAGHRRAHRGRPAAAHPRPAPPGLRHRRGPDRRGPARRAELPSEPPARRAPTPRRSCCWSGWPAMGVPHAVAGGDLNDVPDRAGVPAPGRAAPGLPGRRPVGRRAHLPRPTTRASASTRSSRPRASRCSAAASPPGCPASREADLRAATDHLPVLAALRVPAPSRRQGPS